MIKWLSERPGRWSAVLASILAGLLIALAWFLGKPPPPGVLVARLQANRAQRRRLRAALDAQVSAEQETEESKAAAALRRADRTRSRLDALTTETRTVKRRLRASTRMSDRQFADVLNSTPRDSSPPAPPLGAR